ncbi:MAG TPA: TadE family protein [Terriglobales bacterium]|jgi:Flp pilus assembly protein TadG
MRNSLGALCRKSRDTDGAQIVELAVTLPLMVVIFVGIYDFGQAFNLKQKLGIATREAARFAANHSTADLTSNGAACAPAPDSICAVRDVVDAYLVSNNINDCGLSNIATAPVAQTAGTWRWTFTASGCAGGSFTLVIDRGATFPFVDPGSGNTVTVEATQVSMNYPYQWHFNRVIRLVVPGASYAAITQIPTTAVMQNLN